MKRAFVFPGQGSQFPGMGRKLARACPHAKAVFEEVDEALSEKLSEIIWGEDEQALTLTQNAQPALMAVSLAILRSMEAEGFGLAENAVFVAGHSLGEYSALAAAGSVSIAQTARLLRIRANAMQEAVPVGVGKMAALLGVSFELAEEIASLAAKGDEICSAANDNANGQVVLSGHAASIERAMEIAKEKGAKRAIALAVSAPFHCSLMRPAAQAMQAALEGEEIVAPCIPLIANVSAMPSREPEEIKRQLVEQVVATVRWRESIEFMAKQGCQGLVEIGAGKVLSGLVRRIVPEMEACSIAEKEDIDAFMKSL